MAQYVLAFIQYSYNLSRHDITSPLLCLHILDSGTFWRFTGVNQKAVKALLSAVEKRCKCAVLDLQCENVS